MVKFLSPLRRTAGGSSRVRPWALPLAGLASAAAVAVLGFAAPAPAAPPTDLKGYGLQQYLAGQGGGSTPARPAYNQPSAYARPQRSILQVSPLPYQHSMTQAMDGTVLAPSPAASPPGAVGQRPAAAQPAGQQPVAYVTAHLPPGADLWIEEKVMFSDVQKAEVTLVTPPLEAGKWYTYTARVRWVEDGKWVGQMHTFDVRAGDIHHMEVTPSTAPSVEREIAANLAGLSPADRKAAEGQKFCVVQDTIRLGSMGAPVKVTLDGKDVYLCCKGCEAAARKAPEKTKSSAEKPDQSK